MAGVVCALLYAIRLITKQKLYVLARFVKYTQKSQTYSIYIYSETVVFISVLGREIYNTPTCISAEG